MTRLMQGLLIGILVLIIGANLGTDLGQISGALMVVGAGLVAGPGVARWLNRLPKRGQHLLFWGIFGLTMVIELAVLTFLPVSVIHDPFRVLYQASHLASGHFSWGASDYFYRYPNNAVNAILLAGPVWLGRLFGLSDTTTVGVLAFLMVNILILTSARLSVGLTKQPVAGILVAAWFIDILWAGYPSL